MHLAVGPLLDATEVTNSYAAPFMASYPHRLWEYDMATGVWSLSIDDIGSGTTNPWLFIQGPFNFGGSPFNGGSGLLLQFSIPQVFREFAFDTAGVPHAVDVDARDLPATVTAMSAHNITLNNTPDPGVTVVTGPDVLGDSYLDVAPVLLDGTTWFNGISVDTTEGSHTNLGGLTYRQAFGIIILQLFMGGVTIKHVGEERRGAITASFSSGGGSFGTFWRYSPTEVWTDPAVLAPKLSKTGHWLYIDGDAYLDGVQQGTALGTVKLVSPTSDTRVLIDAGSPLALGIYEATQALDEAGDPIPNDWSWPLESAITDTFLGTLLSHDQIVPNEFVPGVEEE
jgi:hypothetical protein